MKLKLRTTGIIFGTILISLSIWNKSLASDLSIYDRNRMLGASTPDWLSSNIREWLNSDEYSVKYTGLPPSYKNESGFLSNNNFTQSERDGIAVTKHGGGSTSGGNDSQTPYLSNRSTPENHYKFNDKVFILNYTDIINYVERNNKLLDMSTKYFSEYLKNTTNKLSKYEYIVNAGYYNKQYDNTSVVFTSQNIGSTHVRNPQNIVPALSLKPDYVFPNGVKAKDLRVGNTVNFGTYNGEPIEWQIINKSNSGYPLLWSTKIITVKEYDAPGDINPRESNHLTFTNYDVDITMTNGENTSWETGEKILSTPKIIIENEEVLTTPTNDTSITMQIKVTDDNSDIRKIILPDGNVVASDRVNFTLSSNGEYDIIAENSMGVITARHIVTKAINTPAEVVISTDKDESSKWTNKPVNVNIHASNNGAYVSTIPGGKVATGMLSTYGNKYPNWMSLGGKQVRIKGTFRNALTDEEASKLDMTGQVKLRLSTKKYTIDKVWRDWPIIRVFTLQELKDQGEIHIDELFTIPNEVYSDVSPYISLMDGNTNFNKPEYKYWFSDFTMEILDKDDLEIKEIRLPNGDIVKGDSATYTIFDKGEYTFSVEDNRGKITSKTIELDIDMEKPLLDISYSNDLTNKNIVLKVNAQDTISGIKSIKLPNGEYRTNSNDQMPLSIEYNIISNGSYTFEAIDFAGNTTVKTINVTNIDKSGPNINYILTPNTWTTGDVSITVSASDNPSGVKRIVLPDGSKVFGNSASYIVNKNGRYSFMATDNLDNISVIVVNVSNIDKNKPTVSMEKSPSKDWSNTDVYVNINAND